MKYWHRFDTKPRGLLIEKANVTTVFPVYLSKPSDGKRLIPYLVLLQNKMAVTSNYVLNFNSFLYERFKQTKI